LSDALLLGARLLMALMFCGSAVSKLAGDRAERESVAALGLPVPRLLQFICGLCQIAGSAMLVSGVGARLAALLFAGFVVVVTPLFFPFWTIADPGRRAAKTNAFLCNFGVVSGLLAMAAAGPGDWAVKLWA
jgi:putative oxidoreductase